MGALLETDSDLEATARDFGQRIHKHGWLILAGVIGGGFGTANELFFEGNLRVPLWLGLTVFGLSLLVAAFWVFHDLRSEKNKRIAELEQAETDPRIRSLRELLAANLKVGRDVVGDQFTGFTSDLFWRWRDHTSKFIRAALGAAEAEVFATSELHGQAVPAHEGIKLAQPFLNNLRGVIEKLDGDCEVQPGFNPDDWEINASEGPVPRNWLQPPGGTNQP